MHPWKPESRWIFQSEVMLCERQTDGWMVGQFLKIRDNGMRQFKVILLLLRGKICFYILSEWEQLCSMSHRNKHQKHCLLQCLGSFSNDIQGIKKENFFFFTGLRPLTLSFPVCRCSHTKLTEGILTCLNRNKIIFFTRQIKYSNKTSKQPIFRTLWEAGRY